MQTVQVVDTGPDHALVEPVVLRESKTTRMVFRATLVNNKQDKWHPVRGYLVWQRRGPKEDAWQDEATLSLVKMKAGSGVSLDLSTSELHTLTMAVRGLYGYFWQHGLPSLSTAIDLEAYAKEAKAVSAAGDLLDKFLQEHGAEALTKVLEWAFSAANAGEVVKHLQRLNASNLNEVSSIAGISAIKKVLAIWKENESNADEEFWQNTLQEHSFVLSQVFSFPVVVLRGKAYIGGKGIQGSGGKEADYLLQNAISLHALIVEIKTPATPLLLASPYRPPDIFAITKNVSGAVVQVSKYKDKFLETVLRAGPRSAEEFRVADPPCLLIVGHSSQLDSDPKRDSFELFRRGQRVLEIITFDELFKKIELLLSLLEGSGDQK